MKRRFRLTRSKDFQRLHSLGKAVRHPYFVLVYLPNETGAVRIGVTAGKLVGKAVQRNRAKRLIRSALQPYLIDIASGWDVLFIARRSILETDFPSIQKAVQSVLDRSSIIRRVS